MTATPRRSPVVVVLAAVVALGAGFAGLRAFAESSRTVEVVIPAGTGDRIADGDAVSVLEQPMSLEVGDLLSVTNDDDRPHIVGPLTVDAGETGEYRFEAAGTISSTSTVHSNGTVTFVVG